MELWKERQCSESGSSVGLGSPPPLVVPEVQLFGGPGQLRPFLPSLTASGAFVSFETSASG